MILSWDNLIKCTDWLKVGFEVCGKHFKSLPFVIVGFLFVVSSIVYTKIPLQLFFSIGCVLAFLEKYQIINGCLLLLVVLLSSNAIPAICSMFRLCLGTCKCKWLFSAFGVLNRTS